jgi:hypothetical protein
MGIILSRLRVLHLLGLVLTLHPIVHLLPSSFFTTFPFWHASVDSISIKLSEGEILIVNKDLKQV